MAVIACVRVSGIRVTGSFDDTWNLFFQHMEACIAVTMVSLTAFRSVFISGESKENLKKPKPWHSLRLRRPRTKQHNDLLDENSNHLPTIPSATLSGMRTFIQGGRKSRTLDSDASSLHQQTPKSRNHEEGITVICGLSSDIQMVRA